MHEAELPDPVALAEVSYTGELLASRYNGKAAMRRQALQGRPANSVKPWRRICLPRGAAEFDGRKGKKVGPLAPEGMCGMEHMERPALQNCAKKRLFSHQKMCRTQLANHRLSCASLPFFPSASCERDAYLAFKSRQVYNEGQ